MASQDDGDTRFALGFVFMLVAAVLALAVGVGVFKSRAGKAVEAPAVAAPAGVVVEEDVALVKVEGGVVKFYFATAKADLAQGANEALADVVKGVQGGKTAVISGYHDATGDMAANAELAKQRALAVQATLKALGVAEDKVELRKPEQMTGSGSNAEARRVEVVLQ